MNPFTGRLMDADESWYVHSASSQTYRHLIKVDPDLVDRYIWLALDAMEDDTEAAWYLEGKLEFLSNRNVVSSVPFRAGQTVPAGKEFNTFRPRTGAGSQPPLTVTAWDPWGQRYRSVDAPCFFMRSYCDEIQLVVERLSIGAGGYVKEVDVLAGGNNYGSPSDSTFYPVFGADAAGLVEWPVVEVTALAGKAVNTVAIRYKGLGCTGATLTVVPTNGGAGAVLTPTIVGGEITAVAITVAGANYEALPLVLCTIPGYGTAPLALPTGVKMDSNQIDKIKLSFNGVNLLQSPLVRMSKWRFGGAVSSDPGYGFSGRCVMDGASSLLSGLRVMSMYRA
jgi:hypothetical protein